jgi:hypothetical protein
LAAQDATRPTDFYYDHGPRTRFSAGSPLLADVYASQDLLTMPQDLLSPNRSVSTVYGNEAGYANTPSPVHNAYAAMSIPYDSMGYTPAPVRSTYALQQDSSRRLSQPSVFPDSISRSSQAIHSGQGILIPASSFVSRNIGQHLDSENSPQEFLSTINRTDSASNAPSLASRAEHSEYSSTCATSSGIITSLTPTSGYTTHFSDDDDESYESCSVKSVTIESAPAVHDQALPNQKGT